MGKHSYSAPRKGFRRAATVATIASLSVSAVASLFPGQVGIGQSPTIDEQPITVLAPSDMPMETGQLPATLQDATPQPATYSCEQQLDGLMAWDQQTFFELFPEFKKTTNDEYILDFTAAANGEMVSYQGQAVSLLVTYRPSTCTFETVRTVESRPSDPPSADSNLPFGLVYVSDGPSPFTDANGEIHPSQNDVCVSQMPPSYESDSNTGHKDLKVPCLPAV